MSETLTSPKTTNNVCRLMALTLLGGNDVSFLAATKAMASTYHDALVDMLRIVGVAVSEDDPRRVMAVNGAVCTFGSFDVRHSEFTHTPLVVMVGTRLVAEKAWVEEARLIAARTNPEGVCMTLEVE